MVDSVVQSVVSVLLGRTIDLLNNEVNFLHGVTDQVRTLQDKLQWVHAFLKDADAVRQKEGDNRFQDLVSKFRDIAYDAEDAIDTYIFKVASVRNRGGFGGVVKRSAGIFNEIKLRHRVGEQIKAINSRISEIGKMYPDYKVQNIAGTSITNCQPRLGWRRTYAHEEEDVVGLDEDIEKLVAELTNKEGRALVVSIVGIGGSGKTTLVRKLYNHVDIKKHFNWQVWVSISQEWSARDLLINIITQTTSPSYEDRKLIQEMDIGELVKKVHNFLKEKIYLLVLDDVWENEAWDALRPAFPSENVGSKLIITSRIQNVGPHADQNCFVHKPQSLTDEKAWELLLKKVKGVIRDDKREEASRFHELGEEMLKKCSGLPLAIVVLGGLLATKTSLEEWKNVSQNIGSQLREAGKEGTQQYGEVSKVLALSYDSLPYHLKPCFLYLGMHPEDSKIRVKPLIRMWIAEGFISSQQIGREQTLEQAGEAYLRELIQRSLIQVVEKDTTGRPKSCLMHDLLRDLCLEKAREESFLEVFSKSTIATATQGSASKARRIAVHFGDDADSNRCFLLGLKNSRIRSLLCFGLFLKLSDSEWNILCTNLPLLRVLHLQVAFGYRRFPKRIGNLYVLKYLGLACRNYVEIPQSLGNLRSLQTLDIEGSSLGDSSFYWCCAAGEVVQKMEQLRYLHLGGLIRRVGGLKNLQCLKKVEAGDWMARDLPHLPNLQKLGIREIISVEQVKAVLESPCIISDRLQSLHLELSRSIEEYPSLEQLSRCRNLSKLDLWGKITEKHVQLQQQFPPNLTKLSLVDSELREQDPMAALEKLPFLKFLLLGGISYKGTQMNCSANGFPQLQHLKIVRLEELEEWRVEEGAMPHLKRLTILNCWKLRMIPEGLKFITTLQELEIVGMPKEFEERVRKVDSKRDGEATSDPDQGADYYKIRHIPGLNICSYPEYMFLP
ncbi:NB-ARC [Dillenia turbinata]|uniref:NB-ARC n=1 Tax=Dillenia turbinata TaxID=194707 RepID=A0AAN8WHX5_9MAGN